MRLGEALHSIISQKGIEILRNQNLVNYLMDLQAFEEMPSSRFLVKMMVNEGTMSSLYLTKTGNLDIVTFMSQCRVDMEQKWGFNSDVVKYVIETFSETLGLPLETQSTEWSSNEKNNIIPIKGSGQHFLFKGVEICGSLQNAIDELSRIGYSVVDRGPEGALLSGSFAGIPNCNILVSFSDIINEIYSITVMLPEQQTWWGLKADYQKFKEKLTNKYGFPIDCNEFFSDPYYEGDGYEMSALSNSNVFYHSKYQVGKGSIAIMIVPNQVFISYTDNINETRIEKEKDIIADYDL